MTDDGTAPPAMPAQTDAPDGLQRSLGLVQVTASGVGIIIGAGIYVLVGAATALAGPRVWMGFVLAAVLSALTGLSYAELASMFPAAGAEFEYSRQAFRPRVAFLVGWVMIAGLAVASAAVALGFGTYLRRFADVPARAGAVGLIVVVSLIAATGIRRSAALTTLLSLVQVGGLVYVIAIGIPHLGDVNLLDGGGTPIGGVVSAAALVFFAFIGFDEVITLAEETKNPTRTVPRALLGALAISTLLYVLVAITAVSVIGADRLAASDRPLADVLDHALGGSGATAVAVIALIATTNTTMLCVTAASRLQYGMATAHALPARLARVDPTNHAPRAAIAVTCVLATAIVFFDDLTLVASVTDVAVYLVFVAVNLAVIVLRRRDPDRPRPFRTPGQLRGVPVVPVLGIAAVAVMLPALQWQALLAGAILCVAGVVADAALGRSRRLRNERAGRPV